MQKRSIPKEGMPRAHRACFKKQICIPKEGMPHAHKACQKKGKKREKERPHPRKIKEKDGS